ncbi:glycoside hydrolase family 3 N-terminal domain-containing protein [Neorhizobium sp. Rsf11]|uniref:beta-N-acetylhexosaminidase n=2 Tax=Neorhizobium TaxID=1525371 RepID=A0ABV0M9Z0_9HYPH|nr:glycoside hydrolase family 3 N-terminal domain-containing protein [Neorhizobium petrolearium]MCC2614093.1 glycoside hydrolase family 3 protein [Neorhizobium petrolearium]WGI71609.1 glycoside hydrolase family 3 N-terminal domain-containing protein [Neorhizobium petrolearium]
MTLTLDHLTKAPFNLDREALAWVERTFQALDETSRAAQLFNLNSKGDDRQTEIARLRHLKPGGITRFFGSDGKAEREHMAAIQAEADIPLLVSADLEGSRMSLSFGTPVPNPLALAAVDDVPLTEAISDLMAREARSVGINWSFTPVLDINAAFRSPIVATRGYGSDPALIERHALAQMRVFQRLGLAATVKHWPGEGYDERDQHLVTTINPLSMEDWRATFGTLYKAAIDQGVKSVMSAHIALPAYILERDPDAGEEAYLPASISAALNLDLLRGELGFNGLIVSDASEMAGLSGVMPPCEAKIEIIAGGCDMVLFSSDPETEIAAVRDAVHSGRITAERFANAVTRVLALKASLGLHRSVEIPPHVGDAAAQKLAEDAFARAPTLVKDRTGTLPLDLAKHRRILVVSGGIVEPMQNARLDFKLPEMLASEGFEVTLHRYGTPLDAEGQDLVLYLFGEETLLTRGRIFLDWLSLHGDFRAAMKRPWTRLPTVMISFGFPYYLYDAPRVPTYINAYSTHEAMQKAVLEALMGRRPWNRKNPIDPFSGAPDARF